MTKDLNYYLSLNYPIEIIEIPESEGGGVSASIPLLGRYSCVGDGETIQEAIDDLARVKPRVLEELLAKGERIPEPEVEKDNTYSGRILLRLSRQLHQKVAEKASIRGESINRYIVNALEADARARIDDLYAMMRELMEKINALKIQNTWQPQDWSGVTTISTMDFWEHFQGTHRIAAGGTTIVGIGIQEQIQNNDEAAPTSELVGGVLRQIGWQGGNR
jgi:predicted HicB family RNase H-like nuclease